MAEVGKCFRRDALTSGLTQHAATALSDFGHVLEKMYQTTREFFTNFYYLIILFSKTLCQNLTSFDIYSSECIALTELQLVSLHPTNPTSARHKLQKLKSELTRRANQCPHISFTCYSSFILRTHHTAVTYLSSQCYRRKSCRHSPIGYLHRTRTSSPPIYLHITVVQKLKNHGLYIDTLERKTKVKKRSVIDILIGVSIEYKFNHST